MKFTDMTTSRNVNKRLEMEEEVPEENSKCVHYGKTWNKSSANSSVTMIGFDDDGSARKSSSASVHSTFFYFLDIRYRIMEIF